MEFQTLLRTRRSIRRFDPRPVSAETIDRLVAATLTAPSSRNSRSTHLLVVDRPELIARMAAMRDYGSAFMKEAPLVLLVLGDTAATDLWEVNAAISATLLQLACVDEGLASCWVHVAGRPRLKAEPDGERAADYLRSFLPIPAGCEPLCAVAIGYSTFRPAALPPFDAAAHVHRL